jgi:transposase
VVAVPADRCQQSVREFGSFTEDLELLADWLQDCGITTIAMESTGVYWKPLFTALIARGFEVCLVHARHVRNVTGRKTDVEDARWIQKLHSCGLLRSCFLPDDATESLRSLVRHRKSLIEDSTRYVLRMEKAMELMNIKIHSVISDIMGKTGTSIIEAIIAGERQAENFLTHVDARIKADAHTVVKSLRGNWRREQLYLLKDNYHLYQMVHQHIDRCEKEIESILQVQAAVGNEGIIESIEPAPQKKRKKKSKNTPAFNVVAYLQKIHGVDVTDIYGISEGSALEILAETGPDLSKWETEKHFVSWLNLCPNNKITGGKLVSSSVLKKKAGAASQSFRAAANTLQRSDHYLGHYFRRKKAKGGNKYAIIATAAKLATIYYKMVVNKQPFNPIDTQQYEQRYKSAKIAYLEKQLLKLKAVG